jgi:hypothetical protein
MYTFCFVVGSSAQAALSACTSAVSSVAACLPSLGSPGRVETTCLPEAHAAFATLKPEADVSPSLIQSTLTDAILVLVFGEQAGVPRLANAVLREFLTSGVAGVSRMEGNFSAIIVERLERRVWLTGTLLGHRSLFYHASGGSFVASPHDLTLLGSGRAAFEIDYSSLASMVACDWSLMGRSLLANVVRCHPLEAVCFHDGRVSHEPLPMRELTERIEVRDTAGMSRQVERVADALLSSVTAHVRAEERVRCSLTAGMDSRALLAAICGVRSGKVIDASTSGGESSQDVQVARRLARMVGAQHQRQEPTPPETDDFLGSLRLRAFFCSGDTNAKRAMTRTPRLDPETPLHAGGNGGEIFRGFFYQYFGVTGAAPSGLEPLGERLLRWRFRRLAKLPFGDPSFGRAVRERLFFALSMAERCSSDPYDMVDLLYLFERYGRWGALQTSLPWRRTWTPFESVVAIREAFKLPAPIGKHCQVHSLLIRRFLPAAAYWIPINGGQLLALEGPGRVRYALRQALNTSSLLTQQVRRRLQKGARRSDELKAGFLSSELAQLTESLIAEQGSMSRVLFGERGVQTLLDRHRQKRDQLAVVGVLLTAEMWQKLAAEIHARAPK